MVIAIGCHVHAILCCVPPLKLRNRRKNYLVITFIAPSPTTGIRHWGRSRVAFTTTRVARLPSAMSAAAVHSVRLLCPRTIA